ncbi:MAG: DinB family protein [Acidobacteriota bacterium]
MLEGAYLALLLKSGGDGPAWHGPAFAPLLEGLTAQQAAAHPIAGGHSIWEVVLHVAAWRGEVARRLVSAEAAEPPDGDWPEVSVVSASAWSAAKEHLSATLTATARVLEAMSEKNLQTRVRGESSAGADVSLETTVLGLLQHDAYHGGQIALLRRILGLPA